MGNARRAGRGFTLVELMVVIGIIGMLIGLLVPVVSAARSRAVDAQCQTHLRELFLAQTFYANDHGGRYAGVEQTAAERWEDRLNRYLRPKADPDAGYTERSTLIHCPAASLDGGSPIQSTYGVNSCMNLPNWKLRRDRKMDASRIILMGDKSRTFDDYLTTEDGHFVIWPYESGRWYRSVGHSGVGAARHAKRARVNMVMADGHVEAFGRSELAKEGGHWYWGSLDIDVVDVYQGSCCP